MKPLLSALALVAGLSVTAACGGPAGHQELVGTFELDAGQWNGKAAGSYFRMISPGGTLDKGPFFTNPDSPWADKTYTPATAGTDGGLTTGAFQPGSGFDSFGNSTARRITEPGSFTAIKFGISTNAIDPQTQTKVTAPQVFVDGDKLSGQTTAWSAAWNNLYFNQGSPKPDGTSPGLTTPVSGTYDKATGHFVLTWASQVVGGPFSRFTGYWHLEGTFTPKK